MALTFRADPSAKGLQVAHLSSCPAAKNPKARCRPERGCVPRYRRRLPKDPVTDKRRYTPTTTSKAEAIGFGYDAQTSTAATPAAASSRTFEDVGREWFALAERGKVPKRRGSGHYTPLTIAGYRSTFELLLNEWGHRPGDEIEPQEWQLWVDRLGRGVGRSRINEYMALVHNIYAYATRSTRQIWRGGDQAAGLQLPPPERVRLWRVATISECEAFLDALPQDLRAAYVLAFHFGLRRSEMHWDRLLWTDVDWRGQSLDIRLSKSAAGEGRRPLVDDDGMERLRQWWIWSGKPTAGPVLTRSVYSGKHGQQARKAWVDDRIARGQAPLEPISLQEGRRTYASTLVAAGYNLHDIMQWMGHTKLTTTERYISHLPKPGGRAGQTAQLNFYRESLRREADAEKRARSSDQRSSSAGEK